MNKKLIKILLLIIIFLPSYSYADEIEIEGAPDKAAITKALAKQTPDRIRVIAQARRDRPLRWPRLARASPRKCSSTAAIHVMSKARAGWVLKKRKNSLRSKTQSVMSVVASTECCISPIIPAWSPRKSPGKMKLITCRRPSASVL